MSRSLESIIEEIAESEEMSKEFAAIDEIDEIYNYCKDMGLGSSEEEFDEEVSSMINNFDIYASELDKNSLNLVAGGSSLNKKFNKVLASALSALTLAGAGAVNLDKAAAMNSAVSSSASTVSTEDKTKDASKDDKGANASDHYSKKLVEKDATVKTEDNDTLKDKFFKIVECLKNLASKNKVGTGVTTAAVLLTIAYITGVATTGKWNPVRWFGGRMRGGSHVGSASSLSDEEKRGIDNFVKDLDTAVEDNKLTPDAIDEASRHLEELGNNKAAYDYLLEKLKVVGYDPEKVGSGSQVLPNGHMSDTPVSEVTALERSLLIDGKNSYARAYALNSPVKFNDTDYDFSANSELKKKVEGNINAIFNSTSDDKREVNILTRDSTASDAYWIFCFSETGNQVPDNLKFNLMSEDPLEQQAMKFVTDVWKAQQQRSGVQ